MLVRMAIIEKQMAGVGEIAGKEEPLLTACWITKWPSYYKN